MKNPNATAYAPIPNSNTVYSINYDSWVIHPHGQLWVPSSIMTHNNVALIKSRS